MASTRPDNGVTDLQRLLYRWHRRVGIAAALLVLVLAVTGILLSHAEQFGLHERMVTQSRVTRFYRAEPKVPPLASETGAGWIVWIDGSLYLGGRPLERGLETFLGAVATDVVTVAAGPTELLLFTAQGRLVDELGPESLPGRIGRLGLTADGMVAVDSGGVYLADDFLGWRPAPPRLAVRWSPALPEIPAAALEAGLTAYRGEGVPMHRIIADLHSGRIFGDWGPYLMDAAALALVLLAISGLVNWRGTARRNTAAAANGSDADPEKIAPF